MSDFNSLVQYTVENISRPVKYIIYKLTEFIRVVDKFVFRQVPSGAASGYSNIEKIEGNTVKFNQLVQNGDFGNGTNGWSSVFPTPPIVSVTDGILKITKNANGGTGNWYANTTQPTYYSTHKYYIALDAWNEDGETSIGFAFYNANYGLGSNIGINVKSSTRRRYSAIGSPQTTDNKWTLRVGSSITSIGKAGYFANLVIHDLTAIFGAGNEPSTVADFEAWMAQNIGSASYYDYNAGELISCKMSGIQTEDSSQQTLDTLPFDVTTITGINSITNVREVMFSDGMNWLSDSVHDVIDLVNGTATVKCRIKDLGTCQFIYSSSYEFFETSSVIIGEINNRAANFIINSPYFNDGYNSTSSAMSDAPNYACYKSLQNGRLYLKNTNYSDPTAFKTAMNGIEIIYELTTPIIYTDLQDGNGNPLNPRYKVEQGGTEQVLPVNTSTPITVAPTLTTTYTKDVH